MGHSFFMLVTTGILLTFTGIIFHRPLLFLFGASEATYPYASGYLAGNLSYVDAVYDVVEQI